MTQTITDILTAITATGATESSDPLRDYITGLEGQIQALNYNTQTVVDDATNPLREHIKVLEQQAIDAQGAFADAVRSQVEAQITAAMAARDSAIVRLNGIIAAILAVINPPAV